MVCHIGGLFQKAQERAQLAAAAGLTRPQETPTVTFVAKEARYTLKSCTKRSSFGKKEVP